MKKLLTYSAVLATAISVIGCGGGSDSGSARPANTTNTIKVKNSSNFDYATAMIVTDSGTVLFNEKIDCSAGKVDCYIYASYTPTNESVNVLLKDASGRLVRYSDIDSFLPAYTTLDPNNWEMGVYLTKQIVAQNQSNGEFDWLDTNLRLANFFKNYQSRDGKSDNYEELGEFYSKSLKGSTSLSEKDFVVQFSNRLKAWETASSTELQQSNVAGSSYLNKAYAWFKKSIFNESNDLIATAQAQTVPDNCPGGLTTFLDITSSLGQLLPVVGDGVSGVSDIAANACSNDEAKWETLFDKLKDLQDSINNVGQGVAEIKSFLADEKLNSKTEAFMDIAGYGVNAKTNNDNLRQINSDYNNFLEVNIDPKDKTKTIKYKSLLAYIDSQGSLEAVPTEKKEALNQLLSIPMKSRNGAGILDKISSLVSNELTTYVKAINLKCEKLTTSSPNVNFIHARQQCNNIILSSMSNLVGVQSALLPILTDIYAVLDKYTTSTDKYGIPGFVKSYATAKADLIKQFNLQNKTLLNAYQAKIQPESSKPGLFIVYSGISETLKNNMLNVDCAWKDEGRTGFPAISGWFAPTAVTNEQYIVTKCWTGGQGQVDHQVKAHYYYNNQGSSAKANDVSNVLGVLVAQEYNKKGGSYRLNSGSDTVVLKKYYPNNTYSPSDPNVTVTGGNGEYARYTTDVPVVRTAGRGVNSSWDGVWGESSYKGGFQFNNISYSCNLGASCQYNYNWISFKDKKGFSYVIYYWAGGVWEGTNYQAGSATGMSCVTYDCSVVEGSTKVQFKNMDVSVDLR